MLPSFLLVQSRALQAPATHLLSEETSIDDAAAAAAAMVEEDGGGFLARAADDFKVESLRFDSLFKSIRYYYLYAFYLCTWHGRVV